MRGLVRTTKKPCVTHLWPNDDLARGAKRSGLKIGRAGGKWTVNGLIVEVPPSASLAIAWTQPPLFIHRDYRGGWLCWLESNPFERVLLHE